MSMMVGVDNFSAILSGWAPIPELKSIFGTESILFIIQVGGLWIAGGNNNGSMAVSESLESGWVRNNFIKDIYGPIARIRGVDYKNGIFYISLDSYSVAVLSTSNPRSENPLDWESFAAPGSGSAITPKIVLGGHDGLVIGSQTSPSVYSSSLSPLLLERLDLNSAGTRISGPWLNGEEWVAFEYSRGVKHIWTGLPPQNIESVPFPMSGAIESLVEFKGKTYYRSRNDVAASLLYSSNIKSTDYAEIPLPHDILYSFVVEHKSELYVIGKSSEGPLIAIKSNNPVSQEWVVDLTLPSLISAGAGGLFGVLSNGTDLVIWGSNGVAAYLLE